MERYENVSAAARPSAPTLTGEQRAYLSSASFAGALGIFYFAYMGVPGAFFRHFADNLAWTRMVAHARLWAWEAGDWPDFETFRRRSRQADAAAKLLLGLTVPVLLVLLFGMR